MRKVSPKIAANAYIAKSADVVGNVVIGEESSVWNHAVIRGGIDENSRPVMIGERTNIQDGCVLHFDAAHPLTVGDDVTIGHGAIVHGCTVGNASLIGMGAIVMNGAVIGDHCLIGAGALVTENTVIPSGQLVYGSPARIKRALTSAEIAKLEQSAADYAREAAMQRVIEAMDV